MSPPSKGQLEAAKEEDACVVKVNPAVLKDIPNVKKANYAVSVDNHAVRIDAETNSTTGKAAKDKKKT